LANDCRSSWCDDLEKDHRLQRRSRSDFVVRDCGCVFTDTGILYLRDNAEAYRQLIHQSQQIESELDRELTWHEPEETRAGKERSRIVVTKSADVTDQDQWDEYLDWMIEHGEQFHDVFYDRIQRL